MPEMTPQEAIIILTSSYNIQGPIKVIRNELNARAVAVDCLRKVAAGELKPVVHCDDCIYGDYCKRYVNIVADADSVRPVTFCSAGKKKP